MRGVQITVNCTEHPRHELSAALPHLTKANAHRHVLVLAKEHYEGWACLGWWANPRGHFRHMQRLSYSEVVPDEARADVAYYKRLRCETLLAEPNCPIYPHLTSVPYLSTVHWPPASNSAATSTELSDSELEGTGRGSSMAGIPPWAEQGERRYKLLFLGSSHHGDSRVRKLVWDACRKMGAGQLTDSRRCNLQRYSDYTLLMKMQSTFCLEPAGDSPYRRSIADDISFGCIPVLFSQPQETAYSWLWHDWRRSASVHVNRTAFLAGEIDLGLLFATMPEPMLALMRRTIAQHGRKFTIALEDDPGDAVHLLLHGAKRAAERFLPSNR